MAAPRTVKRYEKYAWIILLVTSMFFLLFAILVFVEPRILEDNPMSAVESLTGRTFAQIAASDPGFANYTYYLIRTFDFFEAGLFAFLAVLSATAYRRGERWAWYLTCLFPGLFALDLPYEFLVRGFIDVSSIIFVAILVTGLLLPYRKFFPKDRR